MASSNIPGSEQTSPAQLIRIRDHLKRRDRSLQKCRQTGETGLPQLPRRAVFVVLHALEPHARADLMDALADLHSVGPGEQVSAIPRPRSIVRTRRSDRRRARGGGSAADHDSARSASCHERRAGRKCSEQSRLEIKRCARESRRERIQNGRRKNVRFLHARHLAAQRFRRREQRIGQRDQAVAVVDGVGHRKRVRRR